MPQSTRRGVAPLNTQPRWPGGYIAVLRKEGDVRAEIAWPL